jgi:hypothetical protein
MRNLLPTENLEAWRILHIYIFVFFLAIPFLDMFFSITPFLLSNGRPRTVPTVKSA